MTADLAELLARVEAAEGPDRELDVLLHAQLSEDRKVRWQGNTLLGRSRKPPHDECILGSIDPGRVNRNFSAGHSKPEYPRLTASLDAVLALVERALGPEWDIHAFSDSGCYFARVETMGARGAIVVHRGLGGGGCERERWCLSIISAALRALIAKEAHPA